MATEIPATQRIPMFKTVQALKSFRDAGHSLSTALAEVIDNSIEAKSNKIWVKLEEGESKQKKKKKCVNRIIFGDDGVGMNNYTLQHYLVIGFSTRWMQTDTIGKYGVGAKMAALSFARRVDVWSRQSKSDPWSYVYFDLDEAQKDEDEGGEIGINPPIMSEIPEDIQSIAPSNAGTIVVWSKVDRLEEGRLAKGFDELVNGIQKELSRIFRNFIDGGIELSIQGKPLLPHDPLFLMENTWADKGLSAEHDAQKRGDKDHQSEIRHFPAKRIADEDIQIGGSTKTAQLRLTLYPPEVTRSRQKGGDPLAKKLRIPDNQGCISFVRLDREVAYTNVPRILPGGVKESDRYIGIEIAFKPDLDDFFGIRNVKRGVEPHGELRDRIRGLLKKHINTARKELQEAWGREEKKERKHDGEHAAAVEAVRDADRTMPKGRTIGSETKEEVERTYLDIARDTGHTEEEDADEYIKRLKGLPFVMESVDFPGNMFIDIKHINNQVIIRLNTRHRFYRELWEPLKSIAERDAGSISSEEAACTAHQATESLRLMIIAYAKAQSMNEDPDAYTDLTSYWGQFLDTFMGKAKDVLKN